VLGLALLATSGKASGVLVLTCTAANQPCVNETCLGGSGTCDAQLKCACTACTDSQQCAGGLCNGGICVQRNPAPAVSNHNAIFIAAGLLLAGVWQVRRLARRR
jgi:hypothetical protein